MQARGGKNFSANEGAQHKISRYVPDGKGGYKLKWRTGRTALQGIAKPGEMYGAMRIQRPINGLLSVIDQSRCGILLYTEDGLYVDTIFPDGRRFSRQTAGIYPQPGEFFAGALFPNKDNGKIYAAMGKYTPLLFEMQGWSLTENPVKPLTTLQKSVTISAAQIASPPEIALSLRGGAGSAKVARWMPALGEPAFDGSLNGWESAEPVTFSCRRKNKASKCALLSARRAFAALARAFGAEIRAETVAASRAHFHARSKRRHAEFLHSRRCERQTRWPTLRAAPAMHVSSLASSKTAKHSARRARSVSEVDRPKRAPANLSHTGWRSHFRARRANRRRQVIA